VLGLCLDEKGIPARAEERLKVAEKIYQRAKDYGLRDEDLFIDCLVSTASAQQAMVMETLLTLRMVKEKLGLATVLGVSNVSHGLPARPVLNSTFLAMAWAAGLDLPILNPFDQRMMDTTRAAAVLLNRDGNSTAYIDYYRDFQGEGSSAAIGLRHPICANCNIPDQLSQESVVTGIKPNSKGESLPENRSQTIKERIIKTVLEGEREQIIALVEEALQKNHWPAMEVVNQALIPGIEAAGVLYEQKKYFLPQLLLAAETMKTAFSHLKPLLATETRREAGTIIMATVEGDIHDIGKNIVTLMLENYGFRIIDLGKDVPAEQILAVARTEDADIIGLSALMTTTMPRMQDVVDGVKSLGLRARVMVGGAVLNQEYADKIGADAYSEDARAAVKTAQRLMGLFNK